MRERSRAVASRLFPALVAIWIVDLFAMVVVFLGAVLSLVFLSIGPFV